MSDTIFPLIKTSSGLETKMLSIRVADFFIHALNCENENAIYWKKKKKKKKILVQSLGIHKA